MRDNGIPEAQGLGGLDWFHGLAKEALGRLVSVRDQESAEVKQEHFDHFLRVLGDSRASDPSMLLETMLARQLDPVTIACLYVPEAARRLGLQWETDTLSFVDVTLRVERLHALVRHVDDILLDAAPASAATALVLVAEAEQHTLGAYVLALRLRLAGFSAMVRIAPLASELTLLMSANRFDLALVSMGCVSALDSGAGLVRTLKLLSRGETCVLVGGAIPLTDETLLAETGADRVLRDASTLMSEYDACMQRRALDRGGKRSLRRVEKQYLKGDGVDQ